MVERNRSMRQVTALYRGTSVVHLDAGESLLISFTIEKS